MWHRIYRHWQQAHAQTFGSVSFRCINDDGCHELAKLLKGDTALEHLHLDENNIDDEGVSILVSALQNNSSLVKLNDDISKQGQSMLRITTTLQSNHTWTEIHVRVIKFHGVVLDQMQWHINVATSQIGQTSNLYVMRSLRTARHRDCQDVWEVYSQQKASQERGQERPQNVSWL